jgi:hypothetical protein
MTARTRRAVFLVTTVLGLAALAVVALYWLHRAHAPESVRLLPDADAYVYFDVQTLRTLGAFPNTPVSREPEYEDFVRQTGFQFERDLDEAAFAIHSGGAQPPQAPGASPLDVAEGWRFSEIFIGHFDSTRAIDYFKRIASSTERYKDFDIYVIPSREGRHVRVVILGPDHVAVSNTESPNPIHHMIDSYRSNALHGAGPGLVASYRDHVPLGSVVWGIAKLGDGTDGGIPAPAAVANLADTTVVGSLRPLLGAQMRIEDIAGDNEQAQRIVESGATMLNIFKQLQANSSPSGADEDVKRFFDSIKLEQKGRSAILSADIPAGFLKKLIAEPPPVPQATPTPTPTPAPAPKKKK